MALSQMFNQLAKHERESRMGKIRSSGSHWGWALGDHVAVNPQGVSFRPRKDQGGRTMNLSKGHYVSNCPSPPGLPDDYALLNSGYSVKESICRKCPNRLPNRCCAILRAGHKPINLLHVLNEATEQALKVIG